MPAHRATRAARIAPTPALFRHDPKKKSAIRGAFFAKAGAVRAAASADRVDAKAKRPVGTATHLVPAAPTAGTAANPPAITTESRSKAAFLVKPGTRRAGEDANRADQAAGGAGSCVRDLLKRPESSLRSASRPWFLPATFNSA